MDASQLFGTLRPKINELYLMIGIAITASPPIVRPLLPPTSKARQRVPLPQSGDE